MSSFPRQPAAEQRPASFREFIGLERQTDADGTARVCLGHRPELMNYLQQFHGGALVSVLDAAVAQTIRACLPDYSMVIIDMATHFMGNARGELRAIGRVVRRTRTICFCTAEICDEDDEVIAMASGSFRYRAARPQRNPGGAAAEPSVARPDHDLRGRSARTSRRRPCRRWAGERRIGRRANR